MSKGEGDSPGWGTQTKPSPGDGQPSSQERAARHRLWSGKKHAFLAFEVQDKGRQRSFLQSVLGQFILSRGFALLLPEKWMSPLCLTQHMGVHTGEQPDRASGQAACSHFLALTPSCSFRSLRTQTGGALQYSAATEERPSAELTPHQALADPHPHPA